MLYVVALSKEILYSETFRNIFRVRERVLTVEICHFKYQIVFTKFKELFKYDGKNAQENRTYRLNFISSFMDSFDYQTLIWFHQGYSRSNKLLFDIRSTLYRIPHELDANCVLLKFILIDWILNVLLLLSRNNRIKQLINSIKKNTCYFNLLFTLRRTKSVIKGCFCNKLKMTEF